MVNFENLWKNFPDEAQVKNQCQNKQPTKTTPFDNYCAILLSECFIKSGIDLSGLKDDRCWSHSGKKHILRAEELANSLKASPLPGLLPAQKVASGTFQSVLKDKTGVIFFKDYWRRGKEFFGRVSDLNNSRKIWFWEVK